MAKKQKKKKAIVNKQDNSLAQFKQRLFGGQKLNSKFGGQKLTPKEVFYNLHAYQDFREMRAVAQYVANPNSTFHHFIFGTTFPKSYPQVRTERFSAYTNDLHRDLDWMSLSIVHYAKEISTFVKLTCSFQKAFLLGFYEQANSILESIISSFGLSLWVLEKSFLLSEYAYGLESNKKLMSQIIGDEKNDVLLRAMAEYMSLRCESKLSDENYKIKLDRDLDIVISQLKNYLRYRLENCGMAINSFTPHITFFEGTSPIVDRYLTFIAILQSCAVDSKELRDIVANIIPRVDGLIEDSRIDALLQYLTPDRNPKWDALAAEVLDILDNYTYGHYDVSAAEVARILRDNPEIYELYFIYIHSLDHMKEPFTQVFPKNSLAEYILEHCNVIIRGEKTSRGSADYISKIATTLWRDPLAYGLYDFYVKEMLPSPNKRFYKLALLNASYVNPRFATIYENTDDANKFLDQLSIQVGESSTLSLMRAIKAPLNKNANIELSHLIPEIRRQIYSAEIHEAADRPQLAISILQPLLTSITENKLHSSFYTRDRIIRALFRCYLKRKELAECTDMVVRAFLQNKFLTIKLSLSQLVAEIDETSPPDVMRRITYPILYAIVYTKARAAYGAYDNFLSSIGINRPTQLMKIADQFIPEVLNAFLFRVCTIDVLACSYHFTGTRDLEEERIKICQYLSEKDKANLKSYSDEISTITSRSLIRKGIRQIEVSKIYVDEKGVRNAGRRLLEESFTRYRELAAMSSIETIQMLTQESLDLYILTEDGKLEKKQISAAELKLSAPEKRFVSNSLFRIFKELFMDVRDRFISSGEHGLDGYLSVRIRHGVLQNQIRSPFDALHLIAEKDTTTGEYLSNPYWNTRLEDISAKSREEVQKLLANFAREVDDLAQKINKEMIQVKTEKKNTAGLFDYSFSEAELYRMFIDEFIDIIDFDQFMDSVFRVLWTRTQDNLNHIRTVILVNLKDELYNSISQLDREIHNCVPPSKAAELLQNIARCQTNFQNELESIAQWFTISRSSLVPQFSLDNLVTICIESINNIYPHKKIYPLNNFNCDAVIIDGQFFAPFFDIMRTIIDNAITHSGLPSEKMRVQITVQVKDGRLTMQIKNNLEKQVRQFDPVGVLKAAPSSIETSDVTGGVAREGRSGLMKVRKIMAIDLQREDSLLDFMYDEDENFVVMLGMEMEGLCK